MINSLLYQERDSVLCSFDSSANSCEHNKMVSVGSDLLNNGTEIINRVQNDGSAELPQSNLEDEEWVVAVSQSLQKDEEAKEFVNELEETGILILKGQDEEEHTSQGQGISKSPSLKSEEDSGKKETISSSHGGLDIAIPDDASIPSDLGSLPDPTQHLSQVPKLSEEPEDVVDDKKGDEVSQLTDREDQSLIEESTFQPERGLAAELARADAMFREMFPKTNTSIDPRKLVYVAIGLAVMVTLGGTVTIVMEQRARNRFLQERLAWEASMKLREDRLSEKESKLSEKEVKFSERESKYDLILEKVETLETLVAEQRKSEAKAQYKPVSSPLSPPYKSSKSFRTSGFFYKLPFGSFAGSSSSDKNNFSNYDFERSWHQAEAKLEEVANEATKAVQSGFSTLKRSVSHCRENVFHKVSDFRKRIAKGAERFAMEAEEWSTKYENETLFRRQQNRPPKGKGTVNGTKDTTNFKAVATTLISGVAFAAAATYLSSALEENE